MSNSGLKQARQLTSEGFFYDNLLKMAGHCREEDHPDKMLSAYTLNRVFMQLAEEIGDGPIMSDELRRLEVRYRTPVNLALEKAMAGGTQEEQCRLLTKLIQLLWADPDAE